ncbi:MAG: hypothetical protein JWN04_5795 [Myxococcaceae bacterium]|nr:hypothetical protein [Myxococcaceae bacterium]
MSFGHVATQSARVAIRLLMGALLASCWSLSNAHDDNSFAPGDAYALLKQDKPCKHQVSVLHSATQAVRRYREVASISASCSPGAPRVCEQRLRARACELEADALILQGLGRGGVPYGGGTYNLVSQNARAIRWLD